MIQTGSRFSVTAAPRMALLGCLALLLLGPMTAGALGPEARCTEIDSQGGTCTCSSTFNTPDRNTQSPKRCFENFNGSYWSVTAESAMPAGNSVDYVWKKANPTGTSTDTISAPDPSSSDKRICVRYYAKFNPGFYSDNGAGEREKLQELRPGMVSQFQAEVQGDYFNIFNSVGDNLTRSGPQYSVPNCTNAWCRLEMCWGATTGNLRDGGRGLPEVWVQPLDGSSPENHYTLGGSGAPIAFSGSWSGVWIANLYNQGNTSPNTRYVSHAMAAVWPSNAGQRIGGAYEVESGSAAPPPPVLGPPGQPVLIGP